MPYSSIYEAVYKNFDRNQGWKHFREGSREQVNIADEAVSRHSDTDKTAVRILDFDTGDEEECSFGQLSDGTNQVASFVEEHTRRGERVAAMLPACYELYAAMYGVVKSARVYVPVPPLFGPEALNYRIDDSDTTVLFTTSEHARKLSTATTVEYVVLVDEDPNPDDIYPEIVHYSDIEDRTTAFASKEILPTDTYALMYTSGTTGMPKGIPLQPISHVDAFAYREFVMDHRESDTYFVTASPAWAYGFGSTVNSGIRGSGLTTYRGTFDPEVFVQVLEDLDVTNLMVPPTAFRQVKSSPVNIEYREISPRVIISAGEALDEDIANWCEEKLGTIPLDSYGQSETGMLLANFSFDDWEIKPGSMGKPIPGMEVALLDESGAVVGAGEIGEIAVKRTDAFGRHNRYWGKPEETTNKFTGEWIRTGDLARRDGDGYYWFVSRKDQVINSSGYRIGPDEVQNNIVKHPAVKEAGVIGVPDEVRGQIVKAFVTLRENETRSDALKQRIQDFAREELSKHEYPREIEFLDELPKTPSGKIQRSELKNLD
jgi:acetyl-CoA synthetase